jgi:hypothetical protein
MRFNKVVFAIVILLFLVGCTQEVVEEESAEPETPIESINESEAGACVPSWKCISSSHKAYQEENCTFGKKEECPAGCDNGTCKPETCTKGYKCQDDDNRGYQLQDCSWEWTRPCDFGCEAGLCVKEEIVEINETEELAIEAIPLSEIFNTSLTLEVNDEFVIKDNGNIYTVALALIESGQIRLKINDDYSDWLAEEDNFFYRSINITINEILFQPYDGGLKQMSFSFE